ncbi:hypothetical protein EU527_12000 [Candidatus Thorarchaeota archaeon]|nr:MAG: hypothetical protein EU527_12000 [Candidatus Thorarchaeota archaeon]
MRTIGTGELRLLTRLVIDPSSRQSQLARDLQVSRSAVNQIWKNLERENSLQIRGNIDFGRFGLQMIFGWAQSDEGADVLTKFGRWLTSSKLVIKDVPSIISSTFDSRIYFEAILPPGNQSSWFLNQIDRFRKKPYSLKIYTSECSKISNHMNLGLFDGETWSFPDNFRLEASIGAARGYVDILPTESIVEQSPPGPMNIDELIVAAALESNYYATAADLAESYKILGLKPSSGRTLRRKLVNIRDKFIRPYVDITNIGLNQKLMITIYDEQYQESTFSRVLHAQASTFPKARVVSGPGLTLLELEAPDNIEWLALSQIMSALAGPVSETCTFIANQREKGTHLRSVMSNLTSHMSSG